MRAIVFLVGWAVILAFAICLTGGAFYLYQKISDANSETIIPDPKFSLNYQPIFRNQAIADTQFDPPQRFGDALIRITWDEIPGYKVSKIFLSGTVTYRGEEHRFDKIPCWRGTSGDLTAKRARNEYMEWDVWDDPVCLIKTGFFLGGPTDPTGHITREAAAEVEQNITQVSATITDFDAYYVKRPMWFVKYVDEKIQSVTSETGRWIQSVMSIFQRTK